MQKRMKSAFAAFHERYNFLRFSDAKILGASFSDADDDLHGAPAAHATQQRPTGLSCVSINLAVCLAGWLAPCRGKLCNFGG
jgi:hypothetical protein